jgi:hypothetical protein
MYYQGHYDVSEENLVVQCSCVVSSRLTRNVLLTKKCTRLVVSILKYS